MVPQNEDLVSPRFSFLIMQQVIKYVRTHLGTQEGKKNFSRHPLWYSIITGYLGCNEHINLSFRSLMVDIRFVKVKSSKIF